MSLKRLGCTAEYIDIDVSPNMRQVAIEKQFSPLAQSDVNPLDSSSDVDPAQLHLQTKNSHIRDAYQVEVMD